MKKRFFKVKRSYTVRGRRPLRVPLLLPLSMRIVSGFFYFCNTHTFSFLGPVSGFFAQEGPPNEFFCTFFGRVFAPARVQISYANSLRSGFFCNVEKVSTKDPIEYVGWGLLRDPLLHVLLPQLTKQKRKN